MRSNTIVIVVLVVTIGIFAIHSQLNRNSELVNPIPSSRAAASISNSSSPTLSPQFNYDSSTNLNSELNLVQARVLESDFNSVQKNHIISEIVTL